MSLNRYEQLLYDYIGSWPEEERFWRDRVLEIANGNSRRESAALSLNAELWDYFEERARHETELQQVVSVSRSKLSMLNLAEYLLRMWGPVAPARKTRK